MAVNLGPLSEFDFNNVNTYRPYIWMYPDGLDYNIPQESNGSMIWLNRNIYISQNGKELLFQIGCRWLDKARYYKCIEVEEAYLTFNKNIRKRQAEWLKNN